MSIEAMIQAREALKELWNIIDKIDATNIAAGNDDAWCRRRINHLQNLRWNTGIANDGNEFGGQLIELLNQAIENEEKKELIQWQKEEYKTPLLIERKWVGLTEQEVNEIYLVIEELVGNHVENGEIVLKFPITLYRAFEARLKGKNL